MDRNRLLQAAKFQVEYYFGQTNYPSDDHLHSLEGLDGWIDLNFINKFSKMKKFRLSLPEVYDMMKKSILVDVEERKWDDDTLYYIRKRNLDLNPEFGRMFGYDVETIK